MEHNSPAKNESCVMLTIPSDKDSTCDCDRVYGPLHAAFRNAVQTCKSFVLRLDSGERFTVAPLRLSFDEIRDKVFQAIYDAVVVDKTLTLETKLSEVVEDSLDSVEILMEVEDAFDIDIDVSDETLRHIISRFKSIRDIANCVFEELSKSKSDELGPELDVGDLARPLDTTKYHTDMTGMSNPDE